MIAAHVGEVPAVGGDEVCEALEVERAAFGEAVVALAGELSEQGAEAAKIINV